MTKWGRSGGILGVGETKFLIPVDAITTIDHDSVHVNRTRDHVHRGPQYDPALMNEPQLNDIYGHYGYNPWWGYGYTYPMYPYGPS